MKATHELKLVILDDNEVERVHYFRFSSRSDAESTLAQVENALIGRITAESSIYEIQPKE